VHGRTLGTATIVATGVTGSDSTTVTVTEGRVAVASVRVTAAATALRPNETTTLTAAIFDRSGGSLVGRPVTWQSSDPQVASVDPRSGLVRGGREGRARITATSERVSGSAVITVEKAASIAVRPPPPAVESTAHQPVPAPLPTLPPAALPTATPHTPQPGVDAAAAERADAAAVAAVIGEYVQAYNARDLEAMRRVYPSMSATAQAGFKKTMQEATDWSVKLTRPPAPRVHGTSADADFSFDLAFFAPSVGRVRRTVTARATLQRGADGWRIQGLEGR
jgi:hypothetical protein